GTAGTAKEDRVSRNLRARLERLERRAPPPDSANYPPPAFWDWLACMPLDAEAAAECREFWDRALPQGFDPARGGIEERLAAMERQVVERAVEPRPCGFRELSPSTNGHTNERSTNGQVEEARDAL